MYKTSIYHQTRLHNQKKIITWYTCMSDGILDEGTLFNWAQIKTAYCKKKYITCEMSHSIRTFTLVSYLFYCINTHFYIQDITPIYKYYSIKLNKTYSVPQTYHLNLNTPHIYFGKPGNTNFTHGRHQKILLCWSPVAQKGHQNYMYKHHIQGIGSLFVAPVLFAQHTLINIIEHPIFLTTGILNNEVIC